MLEMQCSPQAAAATAPVAHIVAGHRGSQCKQDSGKRALTHEPVAAQALAVDAHFQIIHAVPAEQLEGQSGAQYSDSLPHLPQSSSQEGRHAVCTHAGSPVRLGIPPESRRPATPRSA